MSDEILHVSMILGLVYFFVLDRPPSHLRTVMKTLPVALLAVGAAVAQGPAMLVGALALSALGDAFLSRKGETFFLAGLVTFLLGHVAYALLFNEVGAGVTLLQDPWRIAGAAGVVLAAIGVTLYLWRPAGRLAPAVAIYTVAIAVMAILSLTVGPIAVFVGAVIFLSSDTALAVSTFALGADRPAQPYLGRYVWASYYAAQLLLTRELLGL